MGLCLFVLSLLQFFVVPLRRASKFFKEDSVKGTERVKTAFISTAGYARVVFVHKNDGILQPYIRKILVESYIKAGFEIS